MNNFRYFLLVLALCFASYAQAGDWTLAQTYSAALPQLTHGKELPRQVRFDGQQFHLAYVSDNNGRFVEYVPAGQTLMGWERMLSVYLHSGQTAEQLVEFRRTSVGETLKVLYSAPDKHEFVLAHPERLQNSVEYLVIHLRDMPGGAIATVAQYRTYKRDAKAIETFRAEMLAGSARWAEELRAMEQITPPILGAYAKSMIFTRKGKENGVVWVGNDASTK